MSSQQWNPGDWAIYRKHKRSTSPGPRAAKVLASPKGETYTYVVDKFWVVEEILAGDRVRLRTARGKTHIIESSDPSLRRPTIFQRLMWRHRFREAAENSGAPHLAA